MTVSSSLAPRASDDLGSLCLGGAKWWDAQAHPTRRDGSGLWRLQAERKAGAAGEVDGAGEDGAAVVGNAGHGDHGVEGWAFDPIAGG